MGAMRHSQAGDMGTQQSKQSQSVRSAALIILVCLIGSCCRAQPEMFSTGHWIGGRITGPDGKTPIRFGYVKAQPIGHKSLRTARTDLDGDFLLSGLEPVKYRLALWTGTAESPVAEKQIDLSGGPVDLDWRLPPMPTLSGRVLDQQGQRVKSGTTLTLRPTPGWTGGTRAICVCKSGADGSYLLVGFSPGPKQILVSTGGEFLGAVPVCELDILHGRSYELDIAMPPLLSIEGRVVNSQGQPVRKTQLQAMARFKLSTKSTPTWVRGTVKTDQQGQYRIADLPAGIYLFCLGLVGVGSGAPREFLLSDRTESPQIDFALRSSASIEGVVVDSQGQAITKAMVYLNLADSQQPHPAAMYRRPDDGGKFRFADLPAGRYRLWASIFRATEVVESNHLLLTVDWGAKITGLSLRVKRLP